MKPTFLWARSGARGTDRLLSSIEEAVSRGEACRWIVPEPYSHATERLLAERGGAPVCLYAEVLTFRRLCDRILAAAGGLASPVLDAGGRLLLLRRAVKEVAGQLAALRPMAAKPGFLPGLMQTLDECKCYGITPQALERAGANASAAASGKLFDLALIFAAYDMLCAQGPADPRDRVTLAWEKVRHHSGEKRADLLSQGDTDGRGVHLYVSHFASFTPQERLLLTALAGSAASFTLLLHGSLTEPGFDPLRATARQFVTHFPQGVAHEVIEEGADGQCPPLRHMGRHWFSRKPPPFAGDINGAVELYAAPSEAAEVRFAAERIVRMARDEGRRWRDIVVITSDYSAYGPLIESIFLQAGVPLFADSMDDLRQKPLSRCIRAAADCLSYGYRAADVMRLLRSGLLPVSASDADLTEHYLRRWNPRGGRFAGKQDWTRPPGGWHDEPTERDIRELERLNTVRRHLVAGIKKLTGKTARQCAAGLYDALEALGVPAGVEARAKSLAEAGERKLSAECGQMWELFCKSLEQCALVLGDMPIEPGEFCDLCLTVLSGYTVGSIPASLDRVHAGDQGRLARIPAPVVFYIGAGNDRVPARPGGEGLLSGEERAALSEAGCELPPDPPARVARELYNLYTACTLPSEKLILTYPLGAGPAGDDNRADCVTRLSQMFAVPVVPTPPPSLPSRPVSVSRDPLSGNSVTALYGPTLHISASRVEAFHTCPFSYFLRYGLQARRRPEPGFTPLDVGRELHAILERCARYAADRGGFARITQEEMLMFAGAQARERQEAILGRGGMGTPRLLAQGERLVRTAQMLAGRLWDEFIHSRFAPLGFELYVEGPETPLGAVPDGAPPAYKLRGVADRVDGWQRDGTLYLRVVDYKTGGKTFSLSDVYNGLSVQMPLYLFLLRRLAPLYFGVPEAGPAGVLYAPSRTPFISSNRPLTQETAAAAAKTALSHSGLLLGDPAVLEAMDTRLRSSDGTLPVSFNKDGSFSKRSLVASPEQMERLQKHVGRLVRDMARQVASGRVDAAPIELRISPCEHCDARAACHFDEMTDAPRPVRAFSDKEDFFNSI